MDLRTYIDRHAFACISLIWDAYLQSVTDQLYHITEGNFGWKIGGFESDILRDAIDRWAHKLQDSPYASLQIASKLSVWLLKTM